MWWRPSTSLEPVSLKTMRFNQQSWMHSYLQASAPRVEALPLHHWRCHQRVQTYLPIHPPKLDGVWDRNGTSPARVLRLEDATEIEEVSLEPIPAHQTVVDVLIEVQQRTGRRPGGFSISWRNLRILNPSGDWWYVATNGVHDWLGNEGMAGDPGFRLEFSYSRIVQSARLNMLSSI